ncbi:FKBP-type peptidyl-prolyl cis-trans isomerase [Frateuria sp. STR12]|uniref:FKBP-type peptidyl-prolyl cis-trans isomerase n=1 Tax=Frateuria hangzhouensis TaxID=2995589 RepID=UPI002260CFC3|nr:FKBP-type peptidyl-prolyl cis-trans isomerase [Frateuria sp. STR12]MCX7515108.1 FKBP-type peptidyl-prolyl cis-trans isomerase [Frateuria sp. STR12]
MKHFLRPTLTAAAMVVALGMTAGVHAQAAKSGAAGTVDKTKASYVVGWDLATQLPPLVREEVDPATVARAVQSALSGQKPTMSEEEAKTVRDAFVAKLQAKAKAQYEKVASKNKADGEAFLAKNKSKPGVKTTASGLQYKVISEGSGARPGPGDTVQVNYVGTFVNGEKFDASEKGKPASIPLNAVIPGFREGLELMKTGAHYMLYIPSNLAYGAQPQNGFPPNSAIIFDVTLVKTGPTPAGGQGAGK